MSKTSIRLKQLRIESHKSQTEISEELGIDRSTYAGYEVGRIVPSYKMVKKLTEYFHTSPDYIFGTSDTLDIGDALDHIQSALGHKEVSYHGKPITEGERLALQSMFNSQKAIYDQLLKEREK